MSATLLWKLIPLSLASTLLCVGARECGASLSVATCPCPLSLCRSWAVSFPHCWNYLSLRHNLGFCLYWQQLTLVAQKKSLQKPLQDSSEFAELKSYCLCVRSGTAHLKKDVAQKTHCSGKDKSKTTKNTIFTCCISSGVPSLHESLVGALILRLSNYTQVNTDRKRTRLRVLQGPPNLMTEFTVNNEGAVDNITNWRLQK